MSKSTLSKTVNSLQGRFTTANPDYTVEAMHEEIDLLNHSEHKSFKELRILRKQVRGLKLRVLNQQATIDSFTPSTTLINQVVSIHEGVYPELNCNESLFI